MPKPKPRATHTQIAAGLRASTRYRDLYDIGLIALELEVDTEKLRTALQNQQRIRTLALPSRMVLPGEEWPIGYEKFIGTLQQPREKLNDVDNALRVLEHCWILFWPSGTDLLRVSESFLCRLVKNFRLEPDKGWSGGYRGLWRLRPSSPPRLSEGVP